MAFNWIKFPWTNLHELNLDWIIQKVRELEIKVLDAAQIAVQYTDSKISDLLTGAGDLTINKSGDVRITANSVQVTGGATFSNNGGDQVTLYDSNSKTGMSAIYDSSLLGVFNNQDLNRGVAVYNVRTPEEGEYPAGTYPHNNFAATAGYVKDKFNTINTNLERLLTGDGDLTISKSGNVSISGNSIELSNTTISSREEQLTLHNSASNTSMTATYNAGMLRLRNNQSETGGVAMYPIVTLPDNTGDNSKYAANVGYVKDAVNRIVTETTQVLPAYTNQIPLSTDASGAVLNGVGYESGKLDTNGAVVDGPAFVSGFIPVKKGDIIRIKDPSSADFSTGLVFAMYKADKATGANIGRYINTMQGSAAYGAISISGNVLTWDTSSISYHFWKDFAYLRVTTYSADSIVTINQEIVETTQTIMTLNPAIRVREENLDFDIGKPLLSGRKVVVFGDSIIGMSRDQTSVPAYAAAYTGAEVYNVGFGGCRMAVNPTPGYAAFSMWALADAVTSGDYSSQDEQAPSGADYFLEQLALLKSINFNDVDMIVIHYGTNDFAANVTINNTSDDDDTATLCGALRYSLRKLMTTFPKIRIFVSVPIYRKWDSTGAETYTNSNGEKLINFCEALAGVASEFNLPVIDGYKALGVNTINDAAFSSDGTHLNQHGRRAFGELLGGKLISPV